MSDLRTAAQQALEALKDYQSNGAPFLACDGAVAALKAALTQQDESEMYAAAYSSACGELRKAEAQRDALLELVVEMDQHEGAEGWSEDLRIKINSALMQALEALAWKAGSEPALYGAQTLQAITALRAALAQQDEPVWMHPWPPVRAQQDEPQTLNDAMQQPRAMAQAYEAGYKAGVAHEREACAQVCEARFVGDLNREDMEARRCAAAIRARGVQS